MISRLWGIILTVGVLVASTVTFYSRVHLQKTIYEFFPAKSGSFDESAFAETRQKLVKNEEVHLSASQMKEMSHAVKRSFKERNGSMTA